MDLKALKEAFISADWSIAEPALDRLVAIGGDEVLEFFLSFLARTDVLLASRASIGLHDLADSRAVEPLMVAILKRENENFRGTMVYALANLDCSQLLPQLFDLLLYGNAEVKVGVMNIFDRQEFDFDVADLNGIRAKWEDLQLPPEQCPDYEASKGRIKQCVEMFLTYLQD